MGTTHELKIWPEYFGQVAIGMKTFEVRKKDRDFKEGDSVLLREWNPHNKQYTGRTASARIGYVLDDTSKHGFLGFVVFSIIDVRSNIVTDKERDTMKLENIANHE